MKNYSVILRNINSDTELSSVVYADEAETSDQIILKIMINHNYILSKSEQYLTAYQQLRDQLLNLGYGLECKGSLLNADQSAMMAYIPKIYLVKTEKQARLEDITNLWDYHELHYFPDSAEQNAFIREWQKSLKK